MSNVASEIQFFNIYRYWNKICINNSIADLKLLNKLFDRSLKSKSPQNNLTSFLHQQNYIFQANKRPNDVKDSNHSPNDWQISTSKKKIFFTEKIKMWKMTHLIFLPGIKCNFPSNLSSLQPFMLFLCIFFLIRYSF